MIGILLLTVLACIIGIILSLLDINAFAAFINTKLTGYNLIINILSTTFMLISVIATIFSGWNYIKDGKNLLKD